MMEQLNHRTVFVLDHTTDQLLPAQPVSLSNDSPLISKSLWTFSVECILEYCRIVWDLFTLGEKKIKVITFDKDLHALNSWDTQSLQRVKDGCARIGLPTHEKTKNSVLYGLEDAIRCLSKSGKNVGCVICIASRIDDSAAVKLQEKLDKYIEYHNRKVTSDNGVMIDKCHLVIINLSEDEALTVSRKNSNILSSEFHSVKITDLYSKMLELVRVHFDLTSTTIAGIPMKLEAQPSSSSKYNVEIYHDKRAHAQDSLTLKWCQPSSTDMLPCTSQFLATPVDVTSNSTTCLVTYLSEHSVLLGKNGKHEAKTSSHLLSARDGNMYNHVLNTSRSIFDGMPSISEDVGGLVIDYRIIDFGNLIKTSKLIPVGKIADNDLVRVRENYAKKTQYWPLTLGKTILHNVQIMEPVLKIVKKKEMTEDEIKICMEKIKEVGELQSRKEALPGFGKKKRDEQYKIFWAELETVVNSSGTSNGHMALLTNIAEYKNPAREVQSSINLLKRAAESFVTPTDQKRLKLSPKGDKSLLEIFLAAEQKSTQNRIEFSGRLCTPLGQKAKLYPNLVTKQDQHENVNEKMMLV